MPLKDLFSNLTKRGNRNLASERQSAVQPPLAGAVLLSKTVSGAERDFSDLSGDTVAPICATLSGGIDAVEPGQCTNFFAMLANASLWQGVIAAITGSSLEGKFDGRLLEALVVAASRSAGRELNIWRMVAGKSATPILHAASTLSREGIALGEWLSHEIAARGEYHPDEDAVSPADLEYYFGSSGYRASALIEILRTHYAGRRFRDVIDLGAGIGFISFLVAQQDEFGVHHTVLVEPQPVRVAQGTRLWTSSGKRPAEDFRFVQTTTQRFAFPEAVDLAIACQSLFYIPPEELSGVIERVWNALRPGGLFVVNEHLSDEPAGDAQSRCGNPILQRERLIALLDAHAYPVVYRRRDKWAIARDPAKLSATELSTDSFLVLEKPQYR